MGQRSSVPVLAGPPLAAKLRRMIREELQLALSELLGEEIEESTPVRVSPMRRQPPLARTEASRRTYATITRRR